MVEINLCDVESNVDNIDKSDYIVITRALKNISRIAKEFNSLPDELKTSQEEENTYNLIKQEYITYNCTTKQDLEEAKDNKDMTREVVKWVITAFSILITLSLIYTLYKTIKNLLNPKPDKNLRYVSISYILIAIIIFNPIPDMSVLTILNSMMRYTKNNYMDAIEKGEIDMMLKLVDNYVRNGGRISNLTGRSEIERDILDEENINSGEYNNSESLIKIAEFYDNTNIEEDLMTTKMRKLDNINDFFGRQEKFILKTENPFNEINYGKKYGDCYNFMLGNNVELLRSSFVDSENQIIYLEPSDIKRNSNRIIKYIEGVFYDNTITEGLSGYTEYFETEFETIVNRLMEGILTYDRFINYSTKYELDTQPIDNGREVIVTNYLEVAKRMRRLKQLNLIEYEHLKNYLFDNNENINRLINIKEENQVNDYYSSIVQIFMNNSNYMVGDTISFNTIYQSYGGVDTSIMINRYKEFMTMLINKRIENDYQSRYKLFIKIIKDVIFIEFDKPNMQAILDYIDKQLTLDNVLEESKKNTYMYNLKTIFGYISKKHEREMKNSGLYLNGYDEVKHPKKYISFQEFSNKMEFIEFDQYSKIHEIISENYENVKFFNNKINDINDTYENKLSMSVYYGKFIYIYAIISFLIVFDLSIWTIFDHKTLEELLLVMGQDK